MQNKLIANILCFVLLRHAKSQYNPNLYGLQQGYQYTYQNLAYPQYSNQRSYKEYENTNKERKNYEEYNDYAEENPCPCDKCEELTPSCKLMCPNCQSTPPPIIAPNYVFLPFPYPYPMSPNAVSDLDNGTAEATTGTTVNIVTTTEATTKVIPEITAKTSPEALIISTSPPDNNDVIKDESPFNVKDKGQYMLTSLRRTKPNWLPKYGIVPIPNKFAEKLMLQLRSMKVLHPQKDNVRTIDDITPLY